MPHWLQTLMLACFGSSVGCFVAFRFIIMPSILKQVAEFTAPKVAAFQAEADYLRKELAATNKLLAQAFNGIAMQEHKLACFTGRHDLFNYMPDLYGEDIECLRNNPPTVH